MNAGFSDIRTIVMEIVPATLHERLWETAKVTTASGVALLSRQRCASGVQCSAHSRRTVAANGVFFSLKLSELVGGTVAFGNFAKVQVSPKGRVSGMLTKLESTVCTSVGSGGCEMSLQEQRRMT